MRNMTADSAIDYLDVLISDAHGEMQRELRFSRDCGSYYTAQGEAIGDAIDDALSAYRTACDEWENTESLSPSTVAKMQTAADALERVTSQGGLDLEDPR